MQRITLAESAGFCFGVNRAVKLLEELVKKNQNVFTLGPIIHNPQVIKHFENKGVRIIDSPDECKEGDLIVVRTHGIPGYDGKGEEYFSELLQRHMSFRYKNT